MMEQAQQASEALALQHAADLYQRALRIDPNPSNDLLQCTALASSAAGRLRDAAQSWLALARSTTDVAQAQRFELKAGACFLRAGDEERGMSVMRGVLRNVGLHWPRTPLLMSTVERARALLRQGRTSTQRPSLEHAQQLQRFDALWGIAKELVLLAPPMADALCTRALREAQDVASPARLLLALGYEAISEANIGGPFMLRRAAALAKEVRSLADSSPSAYDLAYASSVEAIVAWCQGDWVDAEQLLRGALRAYACLDAATAQERHVLAGFLIGATEAQGKLDALRELIAEERIAALQTGNQHALASCELSATGLLDLADDRALQAIERADAVLGTYGANSGFTPLHFQHFVVTAQARLYAGHYAQAYQQVEQAWQSIKRTHLAQLDGVSVVVQQVRARAALGLAVQSPPAQAEALRNQALKLATSLGRSSLTHALALRHVIEANVAMLLGQSSSAEAHCLRASELFDVADMPLMRETARMARGVAGDGVDARLDAGQSAAYLAQVGVCDSARFVAAWFPALRGQLLQTPLAH
jgi:tetratricopeptide (TPR) repeat protein